MLDGGFRAEGEVRLLQAELGGLSCAGAAFRNANRSALNLAGAKIAGAVRLSNGFRAEGEVRLEGAEVGGSLICDGGVFLNETGRALNAEGAKIGLAVLLRKDPNEASSPRFKARGEVRFFAAQIGRTLACDGASFAKPNAIALNAEQAKIGGPVLLRATGLPGPSASPFEAEGEVRLFGAEIAAALDCAGGRFTNLNGVALNAVGAKIGGSVGLQNGFCADGEVRLISARIGGGLSCEDGTLKNAGGRALNLEGAKIEGWVLLRSRGVSTSFAAEGEVRLFGADIAAGLDCSGGSFKKPKGFALHAEGVKIGGATLLRKNLGGPAFKAEGEVRLFRATIAASLDCVGGLFDNPSGVALNAEASKIGGGVLLRKYLTEPFAFAAEGTVTFFGAEIAGSLDCCGGRFKPPRAKKGLQLRRTSGNRAASPWTSRARK